MNRDLLALQSVGFPDPVLLEGGANALCRGWPRLACLHEAPRRLTASLLPRPAQSLLGQLRLSARAVEKKTYPLAASPQILPKAPGGEG